MKTYKGLLCSMLATRMLLGQETPTIQTQPQSAEAQSSQEAVIEYEKQLIANAMTGAASPTSPISTAQAVEAEAAVDATESADVTVDPNDASTFASAQKLFNEMWGVKNTNEKGPKAPKVPVVISTKESNPSITSAQIATTLPPNNLIPFVQEKTYAQNPVAGSDVKLPPMPDTLLPMGKPKLVAVYPKPKIQLENSPSENAHHDKATESADKKESAENKPQQMIPQDEPQVTVSPFVQWIRENQKSSDVAKEVAEQYKTNEAQKDSTRPEDVFLKIRFPYTGSQSAPPASGAVIYSTPQK
ncbi:MAG: hypothetical protein V4507_13780 [Verrucomicrobiota bacterium]